MAVMVVIFLAILLYGIICEHELIGGLFLGLVGGLFIGLLTLVVLDFFVQDIPTGEYKYQVTIDQSVSFIEFNEKYYVIKQDGEIYTIGKR